MRDIQEPTTKCNECFYSKDILGAKTCGLSHSFLGSLVTGCYGGWKSRNIEAESKHEKLVFTYKNS